MVALKTLILGAYGFVGINLSNYLASRLDSSGRSSYKLLTPKRAELDLLTSEPLRLYLQEHQPDVVINLAAVVGGIAFNRDNPVRLMRYNLAIGQSVLEACSIARTKKLIYVGTVCSYPHTPPRIPFNEDDLWAGRPESTNEPYGLAKKTVGLMLDSYYRESGFNSVYLIPTNMYGPHDNFDIYTSHVIPAMIKKFIDAKRNNETITLWGDGSPTREFLYVGDFCQAIRLAIDKVSQPIPINIGTGIEVPMRNLSKMIAQFVGYDGDIIWDASMPNGQPRRCLDTRRAADLLDFRATTSLYEGLVNTIGWYKDHETD